MLRTSLPASFVFSAVVLLLASGAADAQLLNDPSRGQGGTGGGESLFGGQQQGGQQQGGQQGGGPQLDGLGGLGDSAPIAPRDLSPAPAGDDGPAGEELDAPTTHTARQPVATYDSRTGAWLPDCNLQSSGWMQELEIPAGLIDCTCGGKVPGPRCRVWRSFVRPTDPSIDQKCVVCVKEPCLGYETVTEEHRVVIHRCFESTEPFEHEGCEGGRWYQAKGATKLRKLHPCEAKVPLKYQKPVIRYRDVFYYIQCDHS